MKTMKKMTRFVLLACTSAVLAACATNSMTGRKQLMLVSEQTAITESLTAYNEMVGSLSKEGKLSRDPAVTQRVEYITNRLITQAVKYRPDTQGWKWSMRVIDDPKTVNAFCMAGGKMAVYTGLLNQVKPTDDELAQVIGHEIAHAIANHSAEKMSMSMATGVGVTLAAVLLGKNDGQRNAILGAGGMAALAAVSLPNSRTAETEADRMGIEFAARAGYDPRAAVSLWKKMMVATGNQGNGDFLSTHPSPEKRIDSLAALEPQMRQLMQETRADRNSPSRNWLTQ